MYVKMLFRNQLDNYMEEREIKFHHIDGCCARGFYSSSPK